MNDPSTIQPGSVLPPQSPAGGPDIGTASENANPVLQQSVAVGERRPPCAGHMFRVGW